MEDDASVPSILEDTFLTGQRRVGPGILQEGCCLHHDRRSSLRFLVCVISRATSHESLEHHEVGIA